MIFEKQRYKVAIVTLAFVILSCATATEDKRLKFDNYKINDREVSKEVFDTFKMKLIGKRYSEYCDEPIDDEDGAQGYFKQDKDGNEYDVMDSGSTYSIYLRPPAIRTSDYPMISLERRNKVDRILKDRGNLGPGMGDFSGGIDALKTVYFVKLTPSKDSLDIVDVEIGPKEGEWYFTCQVDIKEEKILNAVTETIAKPPL
jgi:hypothetical protein